jgi:hypothetical protein
VSAPTLPARSRRTARLAAFPLLAAVALTATACGPSSGTSNADTAAAPAPAGVQALNSAPARSADMAKSAGGEAGGDVQQQAVISTGQIELTSGDVAGARDRVDSVLTREHGRVADENTQTDDRGTVISSHLVVRVPSTQFDDAMTALEGIATLRSSTRKAEDVTTQVIDTKARIKAEQAGVRRLRQLVTRAADLRALLAVERELTARRGELESLRQQRAYLADQTSRATITVDITRHVAPSPVKRSTGGFVGGLHHGWHALVSVVVGLLVGVGAGLPFALVLVLLGVPAWLVARRMRRPRDQEAPAES